MAFTVFYTWMKTYKDGKTPFCGKQGLPNEVLSAVKTWLAIDLHTLKCEIHFGWGFHFTLAYSVNQ